MKRNTLYANSSTPQPCYSTLYQSLLISFNTSGFAKYCKLPQLFYFKMSIDSKININLLILQNSAVTSRLLPFLLSSTSRLLESRLQCDRTMTSRIHSPGSNVLRLKKYFLNEQIMLSYLSDNVIHCLISLKYIRIPYKYCRISGPYHKTF